MPSTSFPTPANHHEPTIAAEISTPIEVSGADGMRAAEVRIQFDPSEVTTDASQIRSGSVWGGHAALIANVDQEAGTIVAFVFSANPVASGDGELIDIDFTPQENAPQDGAIVIDVQRVRLNEGKISLTNEPVVGPDSSDGRIDIVASDGTNSASRHTRGVFVADTTANEENCKVVTGSWQSDARQDDSSWQGMRMDALPASGPRADVQGPLPPDAVDYVFRDMLSPHHTTKQDFNVRATWHVR